MDENLVMIPSDEWEIQIINCFLLSIKGGFGGVDVEYDIVKDFTKNFELDSIDLYQLIKYMAGELNSGK